MVKICYYIEIYKEWIYDSSDSMCFGYVPKEDVIVHNANLMGAKLFSRLFRIAKKTNYKDLAYKSANYSVSAQRDDGSWEYGNSNYHGWVDNFHTGFNLVSIEEVRSNIEPISGTITLLKGMPTINKIILQRYDSKYTTTHCIQ